MFKTTQSRSKEKKKERAAVCERKEENALSYIHTYTHTCHVPRRCVDCDVGTHSLSLGRLSILWTEKDTCLRIDNGDLRQWLKRVAGTLLVVRIHDVDMWICIHNTRIAISHRCRCCCSCCCRRYHSSWGDRRPLAALARRAVGKQGTFSSKCSDSRWSYPSRSEPWTKQHPGGESARSSLYRQCRPSNHGTRKKSRAKRYDWARKARGQVGLACSGSSRSAAGWLAAEKISHTTLKAPNGHHPLRNNMLARADGQHSLTDPAAAHQTTRT